MGLGVTRILRKQKEVVTQLKVRAIVKTAGIDLDFKISQGGYRMQILETRNRCEMRDMVDRAGTGNKRAMVLIGVIIRLGVRVELGVTVGLRVRLELRCMVNMGDRLELGCIVDMGIRVELGCMVDMEVRLELVDMGVRVELGVRVGLRVQLELGYMVYTRSRVELGSRV